LVASAVENLAFPQVVTPDAWWYQDASMVVELVLHILAPAVGAVALAWSSRSFRRQAGVARASWQQVQDEANGRLRVDSDEFHLTAELYGALITARAKVTPRGTVTRVMCKAVPDDANLTIRPIGTSDALFRSLGVNSFQLGDPSFDERFCVEADDEDLARAWLRPGTRQAVLDAKSYRFRLVGGAVKATRPGLECDSSALHGALRACGLLARCPFEAMDAWNSLASSLEASRPSAKAWQPGGDIAFSLEKGGCRTVDALRCVVRPGRQEPSIVTRIVAQRRTVERQTFIMIAPSAPQGIPIEGVVFEDGSGWLLNGERVPTELALPANTGEETRYLVDEVDPVAVVADEQSIALYLKGPVFDLLRIRCALELSAKLAGAPTLGVYR
jgi:hypothetical protein